MEYRIRYNDGTWLGRFRRVITKKAALTFNAINKAKEVAANTAEMYSSKSSALRFEIDMLGTWKIIV